MLKGFLAEKTHIHLSRCGIIKAVQKAYALGGSIKDVGDKVRRQRRTRQWTEAQDTELRFDTCV